MIEKIFTIKNKLGLHARPAAMFVMAATKFKSKVRVIRGDQEIDGKSIMGLMMIAAEYGAKLNIIIDGDDEHDLLKEISSLFERKFDED
ncbi:MAG: HPr family phosphocarrier protein [bacterium]